MNATADLIPDWVRVWRGGLAPVLPTAGLEALRDALRTDDSRLTQGSTTTPPPLMCVADYEVEAACALGYCGVVERGGWGAATVGEVEESFARWCHDCGRAIGQEDACRSFLCWFDDTPRDVMRRELLPEVERELARRGA